MKIYTEERVGWMGNDANPPYGLTKYRWTPPHYCRVCLRDGRRGICHPELCFGNRDPERLIIVHLREADVVRSRRMALFKLAWLFLRDALGRGSSAMIQAQTFRHRLQKIADEAGIPNDGGGRLDLPGGE